MPWVEERQSINQRFQIGAESTSALGTIVAATKLLECYDLTITIATDLVTYTPTGHKYPNIQEENEEWVDIAVAGNLDYNGVIYPLGGVCGATSPVAHGASSVAKDWIFGPPVTGSIVPQTYTLEQGDIVRAQRVAFGLFTAFGYKGTRKDFTVTGAMLAQSILDAITLTPTPVAVPVNPVIAKQVNVYLDTTAAALGTTLLTRVLSVEFDMSAVYGPMWVLNRANVSWTNYVDLAPKATVKLMVEADVNGMALLPTLQAGTSMFMRVQALGAIIDNLQTLTIGGGATSGTFSLTYKGATTAPITYSAALTSTTVNTAFQLLSTVSTNCTVSGSAGGPYTFTFSGPLASDPSAVTVTNISLSGGTPTVALVAQAYATFQHDMAIKIGKPSAFSDSAGVFAIEFECPIIEDFTWGKSQLFTITNLLTAL
jgi:hypothetical protein